MAEEILDNFETKEKEIKLNKSKKLEENFFLFLSGIIFGLGFLMVLVNGYYHVYFIKLTGRPDLIARLGFLSYLIGKLFYPTSIILIGIVIWILNQMTRKGFFKKLIFSILGLAVTGILLYGGFSLHLIFGPKEKWILGIILIGISIFILSHKMIKFDKLQ